jgi:hypothetical protein
MRLSFALVLLLPSLAHAQPTAAQKKETAKWVLACEAPGGGFCAAPRDPRSDAVPKASLRATNAGVKALKYLGAEVPNKKQHAAFVLTCFDPKTGGFAEPGGKPDVTTTAIGVMAAGELDIPHEKYRKAMDYLKKNAKTFEEVRIGAAAVEAWGVKDCPFDLKPWFEIANAQGMKKATIEALKDGEARTLGSVVAFNLRLGLTKRDDSAAGHWLALGQREDGGWGTVGAKASDVNSTYRVMRAFSLVPKRKDEKWFSASAVRKFVESHRNKDGGYATEPGGKSTINGAYYAAIISQWLDELEKK